MKNYITIDDTIGIPSHTEQNPAPATSFASLIAPVGPEEMDEATLREYEAHLEEQERAYDAEYEFAMEDSLIQMLPWYRY